MFDFFKIKVLKDTLLLLRLKFFLGKNNRLSFTFLKLATGYVCFIALLTGNRSIMRLGLCHSLVRLDYISAIKNIPQYDPYQNAECCIFVQLISERTSE